MERRTFIGAIAGGLLAAPLAAEGQQAGKVWRIAYLGNSSAALESELVAAFRQGLRDLNYVEGRNIVIEYRWAEGQYDRFPGFVAEAVQSKVDVIVTAGTPAILAAKEGTRTIPIVMAVIGDPIAAGVVPSLALLKELVPRVSRVAVLWNPANPNNAARLNGMQAASGASTHIGTRRGRRGRSAARQGLRSDRRGTG